MPTRHLMLTILLVAGAALVATMAGAAEREATIEGASLQIVTPCARSVDIQPDPALHGRVTVRATADRQAELDRLVLETARVAQIRNSEDECWRPYGGRDAEPTLTLSVRVPAGFALTVDEGASGRYTIGPVGGALSLDLSGAATVKAADSRGLALDLSGSGTVEIARVAGVATIALSGHGTVTIDDAVIDALDLEVSGAGGLTIGAGTIGTADLDISGAGDVALRGETREADVSISGAGSVRFARVTNGLHQDVSGLGSVSVGN